MMLKSFILPAASWSSAHGKDKNLPIQLLRSGFSWLVCVVISHGSHTPAWDLASPLVGPGSCAPC